MVNETLMGDEAIALAAVHAGLSGAFAYPGTPATEIMEYLQELAARVAAGTMPGEQFVAQWCLNEKTAYEDALGASFAGRRTLVSMKHVGLNVAADPFVNSGLVKVNGGLVLVVADDPGMHSSQDEQDSRWLADFARVPCFEPANQQEAYDMTRQAFDLSEKYETPVMIRITTRLAHSRSVVSLQPARAMNPIKKPAPGMDWILMPAVARRRWKLVLERQRKLEDLSSGFACNTYTKGDKKLGVITCGLALQYYLENLDDYQVQRGQAPTHLHIGFYPMPTDRIRELYANCDQILVIEEGYPLVERLLRGIIQPGKKIMGKETGEIPYDGELSPDTVRAALGLSPHQGLAVKELIPPGRPPQLCVGCPHADSYNALKEALLGYPLHAVTSDIGCYTLGALPPFNAIETTVDMGASIGMARGASEVGLIPVVAVIGDSTFYHSGLSNLIDVVSHNTDVTVLILDNDTTGMTGAQPTILPSSRLEPVLKGIGVAPEHIRVIRAHKNEHDKNVAVIKEELAFKGPSVVVLVRECLEAIKKARKA
ncbi:MAG: indolepyruvate ferredoxin oxidoreductase [Spirochaetes bacterium GWD1_61_31]|nr:MAG: indolepyruvate ferredoxin oxidoreductase [Spirochaetes bacterium GWB1_60_80]OHD40635.1 MAG: indolepyruvate ferredoxin oxidoreductase [Spirochaetes bacterium GWD1_61_31]OHD43907.1 MAG: indolepyruvate ferredoxin oxidoreductase [Spirochaetes bacterium GWE1_60_18]OHD59778.1 MAG: indolepyruvate ferredoxin oxidoreductase [Spirochaetes bacterium GWF1_60_12]HAP43495.1 indolepyruvate ferredoxin oxidoreductase [Spirochaetaceae bacterium]